MRCPRIRAAARIPDPGLLWATDPERLLLLLLLGLLWLLKVHLVATLLLLLPLGTGVTVVRGVELCNSKD